MRKIEIEMNNAIINRIDKWINSNTAVFYLSGNESGNPHGSRSEIFLHGNHIADYWHNTTGLDVDVRTLQQWPSNTTKSRLRALGANITTKNHVTYLNGVAI